jgi:hypothetical protein
VVRDHHGSKSHCILLTTHLLIYTFFSSQVSLDLRKIDMSNTLRETANKAIIWQVPNINKAFIYRNAQQELMLKIDGINITVCTLCCLSIIIFVIYFCSPGNVQV